ncbi:MAG: hypothetical protein HW421_2691 [Ignavibacteria bacterium]|nr:hypothetical protein [Ignavibacteria bacterium]
MDTVLIAKNELHLSKKNSILIFSGLFFLLSTFLIISLFKDKGVSFLIVFASIIYIYIIANFEKTWIYLVCCILPSFFQNQKEGLSSFDIFSIAFLVGGIIIWFIVHVLIYRKKIITNKADWLLLLIFFLLPINFLVSYLNDVPVLEWIRMYGMLSLTLYYFPLKLNFNDKKHLLILLSFLTIVILIVNFGQLYHYYNLSLYKVVYAYQYGGSVRTNQPLFLSVSIFSLLMLLALKKKIYKIPLLILFCLNVASLITTFSRIFWVFFAISIIYSFFYLSNKKKFKIITYTIVAIAMVSLIGYFVVKENIGLFFQVVEQRFSSVEKGTADPSARARFSEYEGAYRYIKLYPLSGNGLGSFFYHFDTLNGNGMRYANIHNGYIFLTYTVGIGTGILFIVVFVMFTIKAEILTRHIKDDIFKILTLSCFLSLFSLLSVQFACTLFFDRTCVFIFAIIFAIISISENQYRKEIKVTALL